MNIQFILLPKACPWCFRTPILNAGNMKDETWIWKLQCKSWGAPKCSAVPSVSVSLRGRSKRSLERMRQKLEHLVYLWNGSRSEPHLEQAVINVTMLMTEWEEWSMGGPIIIDVKQKKAHPTRKNPLVLASVVISEDQ